MGIQHNGYIEFGSNHDWWPEDATHALGREQERRHGRPLPASPVPEIDPAVVWHTVTLPAAIAAGTIIDRGPDFLAKGFATRHVYAGAA